MNPLSVAIIGTGNIAGRYDERKIIGDGGTYTHAGAYASHGGFEAATVFDVNRERAESFRRVWAFGRVAANLDEIYNGFHDVISVCTPDQTHFPIVRDILTAACCRTILVEKPVAMNIVQIEELLQLAADCGIHLVINFQRRNEPVHREVRDHIASHPGEVLSVGGHYMKGLSHIGVTMIDTICYVCGYPEAVLTYNRVFNQEIDEYSYEFVLYYPGFTAVVQATDAERFSYNYHIFEIDFLMSDRRLTLVDISQGVKETPVTGYAYSGVKVLNERESQYRDTAYKSSMKDVIGYIYDITTGVVSHEINTLQSSWNNLQIINHVIESFDRGSVKLHFEQGLWKK